MDMVPEKVMFFLASLMLGYLLMLMVGGIMGAVRRRWARTRDLHRQVIEERRDEEREYEYTLRGESITARVWDLDVGDTLQVRLGKDVVLEIRRVR